jgi:PhoH-like ATPase
MQKTFVLDTSVLLHDASCIFRFEDNNIILPIAVIEELDTFKKDQREVGRNARQIARGLKDLMTEGSIRDGVVNEKGGSLRVSLPSDEAWSLGNDFDPNVNDNKIINCAKFNEAILVSNDVNLRIKAEAAGVISEDYYNDKIDYDEMYSGTGEILGNTEMVDDIHKDGFVPWSDMLGETYPNKCFLVKSDSDFKHSALVRYSAQLKQLHKVEEFNLLDIAARNMEQHMALDMLMDPNVKLITLVGLAGCGKSLMALLAGIYQVIESKAYEKLLVYRPIVPMGNDLGYMPGDMQEKLAPWMQPISDNIEFIMGRVEEAEVKPTGKKGKTTKADKVMRDVNEEKKVGRISGTAELQNQGYLELGALTFIRGRSIPNQYMIIDEAQNCSVHEIKTIITRVGEGTKIILTGDPSQIDSPYLDSENNGLTYVAEKFKNEAIAGHIVFTKSERSELAEIAARIL